MRIVARERSIRQAILDGTRNTAESHAAANRWLFVYALLLLTMLAVEPFATNVYAQEAWEYSPYRVRVWVSLEPTPLLTERLEQQILKMVVWRADIVDMSAWRVESMSAPAQWRSAIGLGLDQVKIAEDAADDNEMLQGDKLILASVSVGQDGYDIQARQLDCRYRTWGPLIKRTSWQLNRIPLDVYEAVQASFVPLARIEKIKGKDAEMTVRAGGLVRSEASPASVPDTAIFQPLVRRNDRVGNLREKNGIQIVPWTLMQITDRQRSTLYCTMHSGMRTPITGRSSPRIEKVALMTKISSTSTRLLLQSNDKAERPLPGYKIYSRTPDSDKSEELGLTDWRGTIDVPQQSAVDPFAAPALRVLYVQSGDRLLARLPMVPGFSPEATAFVPDDDHRLAAKGIISGFENQFLALTARHEMLAARTRNYIEERQFEKATQLIAELRNLESRSNFQSRLKIEEQKLSTPDERTQSKIDAMFAGLRRHVNEHLDPQMPTTLESEMKAAQKGGPVAKK